jgi:membrane-associated phospholipid phosphatase
VNLVMRRRASIVVARTSLCAAVVVFFDLLGAAPALARQAASLEPAPQAQAGSQPQDEKKASDTGRRTVAGLPANLGWSAIGIFSTQNLRAATIGVLATGGASLADDDVADALADPDAWGGFDAGGRPALSGAVVGALFVVGRFTGGGRFSALTYDWAGAALVNAGYTVALKKAVGRERPNGADHYSFPSGHASNAFALAAVAERHYGWKVGIVAYGLAATVGVSRLRQNAHYLSDVVGGATLGHIVGRTVVRMNGRPAPEGRRRVVSLLPIASATTRALVVHVSF